MENAFRHIPKVDEVLSLAMRLDGAAAVSRTVLVGAIRTETEHIRSRVRSTGRLPDAALPRDVARRALAAAVASSARSLRPVINATGVLLHTNLGRAPLGEAALKHAVELASGYSNLEYDLAARDRGDRYGHCARSLEQLSGAEAAIVVNNNAAAMVLALAALAAGKEAIVSRGELIEIGGSFRLPEVFETSGVRLVEVGTTNRTYRRDYEAAVTADTRLLLKAHRSNFEVVGFTESVSLEALASVGVTHGVPTVYDLGSGSLVELDEFGLHTETVPGAIAAGVDLVAFSGDKLLGGPQAGIIVGRRALVDRLRRHPLMRALRVDKLTLAVLEATLESYTSGRFRTEVPLFEMLSTPIDALTARAEALRTVLVRPGLEVAVRHTTARVGGGTLPTADVASVGLQLRSGQVSAVVADRTLRERTPAVIGRLEDGALIVDLRAVKPAQDALLGSALAAAYGAPDTA